MVPVGDTRLHLTCLGEGEPTIVLEALSGGASTEWAWIQPELARVTHTCSYDRAGRPWSDSHQAGDLRGTAETLHALLAQAHLRGPFILVGHSIGGLYARAFQARRPDEIAGLVLFGSGCRRSWRRSPPKANTLPSRVPLTAHWRCIRIMPGKHRRRSSSCWNACEPDLQHIGGHHNTGLEEESVDVIMTVRT